jgi:hypothetical protein
MWIAPNMVTLLGFMFIVFNVFLIEIFMPDMIGPVRLRKFRESEPPLSVSFYRVHGGCTLASLSACGCESKFMVLVSATQN